MPKYIYLYGPDGSGKTAVALEIKKLYPDTKLVPFEPYKLSSRKFDSGYKGKNSASDSKVNKLHISYILFLRYLLNDILFKLSNISSKSKYIIYTRGILEFGINKANKSFPNFLSKLYKNIFQKNSILVITPANKIIERHSINLETICFSFMPWIIKCFLLNDDNTSSHSTLTSLYFFL